MLDILVVNFQDSEHPYAGGAEVHFREVFRRLVARGHRVTLLCCGWRGALRRAVVDGIDIHRVGTRATFPFLARRYFARQLARDWDVVVEDLNKVALRVPSWSDRPSAVIVHHLFGRSAFRATNTPTAAAVIALEMALGRLYRGVPMVAVSNSTANDLRRRGVEHDLVTVISNGVTDPAAATIARPRHGVPRIISLGRLQPYKRVDVLLRAARRLVERGVRFTLDVVGDGASRASLERLARTLGLEHHVVFHGHVSETVKQSLLARATLHVTTSEKEGWGLSVMEAGVWRVPTVATFVSGLCDSVIEGRTGRFVRPNDAVDTADVIQSLLNRPAEAARLGRAARCFALEHTWDRVADRMERFLASVARRGVRSEPALAFAQRDPFHAATLPRNGTAPVFYGAAMARLVLTTTSGAAHEITVTFGARDADGRWPLAGIDGLPEWLRDALVTPEGTQRAFDDGTVLWEPWAWPADPLRWLEERLRATPEIREIRRV